MKALLRKLWSAFLKKSIAALLMVAHFTALFDMIKSFKCKETERLFHGQFSKKLPQSIQRTALRKLIQIHAATTLDFLRTPPANHVELLTGNRQNQYSIRINEQWRICFQWQENNAFDVEIVDYH